MDTIENSDFWNSFAAEYWDQKTGIFRNVLQSPLLNEASILGDLTNGLSALAKGLPVPMRLFVGDRSIQTGCRDVLQFIPETDSLQQYGERMAEHFDGETFGIVYNGYDRVNIAVWRRLRKVAVQIVERYGLPAGQISCVLFVGNYRTTPFGIHIDPSRNVMSFGITGVKRMLAWPVGYFDNRQDVPRMAVSNGEAVLAEPETFLDDAEILEYGPNDMIYWPSSYWHCVHQDGGGSKVHVSVNLLFDSQADLSRVIASRIEPMLRARLGDGNSIRSHWEAFGERLPTELDAAVGSIEDAARSGELRKEIERYWMMQALPYARRKTVN